VGGLAALLPLPHQPRERRVNLRERMKGILAADREEAWLRQVEEGMGGGGQ
jgi:hypothetical protein